MGTFQSMEGRLGQKQNPSSCWSNPTRWVARRVDPICIQNICDLVLVATGQEGSSWIMETRLMINSCADSKDIKPVNPKGNQPWIFTGRTDAETESPILWPPDAKSWFIGKDSDAGKDWGQEEKGTTEDEMVGWHHQLNEHEFEQVPGVGDGQGSLVCCCPWGRKESKMAERLHWIELCCMSLTSV